MSKRLKKLAQFVIQFLPMIYIIAENYQGTMFNYTVELILWHNIYAVDMMIIMNTHDDYKYYLLRVIFYINFFLKIQI